MSNLDDHLREKIASWIGDLQRTESVSADRLSELESHLIDSVSDLQRLGLSDQEAFTIATARLGEVPQLAAEYGKTESSYLWSNRVFWMCIGYVAISVMGYVVDAFAFVAQMLVGFSDSLPPVVLNWTMTVFAFIGWALMFVVLWRLATHARLIGWKMTIGRFVVITVTLILLADVAQIISRWQLMQVISAREFGEATLVQTYASFAAHIALPIALALFAWHIRKRAQVQAGV